MAHVGSYVGRFAPSPTGALHFGSLVAALASWLDARHAGGRWLLRMEDLDRPRVVAGAADAILRQLEALGLAWDGPVVRQSTRRDLYEDAIRKLKAHNYPCACTRKELEDSALAIDGSRIYPGTCRGGLAPGKAARAIRVRTPIEPIRFTDRVQGELSQSLEKDIGDFVVRRADGLHAYQLAVVVDDAAQGITDVVRGADLLDSTPRQIYLQRLLGFASPRYLHVPVAVNAAGEKLAKQTRASDAVPADLPKALRFLGLPPPGDISPADLLAWATEYWDAARVPRARAVASGR
ncbi:MAG TPA: tRNA glutamyl-Q(34) synthetase GluQRS [Burkholderiales bacterium]|nr:tRNA glutamyl-Q(34) synthetase GluQRS [Burkholderiales bacterium]